MCSHSADGFRLVEKPQRLGAVNRAFEPANRLVSGTDKRFERPHLGVDLAAELASQVVHFDFPRLLFGGAANRANARAAHWQHTCGRAAAIRRLAKIDSKPRATS